MHSLILKNIDVNDSQQQKLVCLLFSEADHSFPDAGLIELRVDPAGNVIFRSDSKSVVDAVERRDKSLRMFRDMVQSSIRKS